MNNTLNCIVWYLYRDMKRFCISSSQIHFWEICQQQNRLYNKFAEALEALPGLTSNETISYVLWHFSSRNQLRKSEAFITINDLRQG